MEKKRIDEKTLKQFGNLYIIVLFSFSDTYLNVWLLQNKILN